MPSPRWNIFLEPTWIEVVIDFFFTLFIQRCNYSTFPGYHWVFKKKKSGLNTQSVTREECEAYAGSANMTLRCFLVFSKLQDRLSNPTQDFLTWCSRMIFSIHNDVSYCRIAIPGVLHLLQGCMLRGCVVVNAIGVETKVLWPHFGAISAVLPVVWHSLLSAGSGLL